MQIVIDISKDRYDEIMAMDWVNCRRFFDEEIRAIHDGKPIEKEPFDEIIDKAVKEIFVQCKQTNPNYSKDWNEGFNDGMFHTITIIKGIRKGKNAIKR